MQAQQSISTAKNRIRKLRQERDWTQADLAKRMDTTNVTVSRWEGGTRSFGTEELYRLARVFDVSVEDILPHLATAQSRRAASKKVMDTARDTMDKRSREGQGGDVVHLNSKASADAPVKKEEAPAPAAAPANTVQVPVRGARDGQEFMTLDRGFLSMFTADPAALEIWIARDDAMSPTIKAGELVFVDTADREVGFEGVYAIRIAGQEGRGTAAIRRLARDLNVGGFDVTADKSYSLAQRAIPEDRIQIAGRVVSATKRLG